MLDRLLGSSIAKPPNQLLRLRVLITLGGSAQDLGEPQAATTYYQQALEWSSEIGDLARIAFIHQGLGNAYRALGDQDAAAGHYQRALAAAELGKDLVGVLIMRNALAVIAADAGRIEAAYEHVARAIEIARVRGPRVPRSLYSRESRGRTQAKTPRLRVRARRPRSRRCTSEARTPTARWPAPRWFSRSSISATATREGRATEREVAATYKALVRKRSWRRPERLSRQQRAGDLRAAERYSRSVRRDQTAERERRGLTPPADRGSVWVGSRVAYGRSHH